MKKFIFILLAVYLISSTGYTQWVQTSGPTGGMIYSFINVNNKIYAGSLSDAFSSTNYGVSWSKVSGLSGKAVLSFANIGNNIFAGTESGVFLSTNNGINWNAVNSGLPNYRVSSLSVSGSILFAGLSGGPGHGAVYCSSNNGGTWTQCINYVNISALYISGSNIFAGTFGTGVFISTNSGASWAVYNNGLTNLYIYSINSIGNSIFAGTSAGVFVTTNNGMNWNTVNTGITNLNVRCLGVTGINIFAGTTNNIYLSTNSGISWSEVINGLTPSYVNSIYAIGVSVFVGTTYGIYSSTNNGSIWTERNEGLIAEGVRDLVYSGGNLYVSANYGILRSTNNGDNWISAGLQNYIVNSIAVLNNYLFAATSGGTFRTTNNGVNWTLTALIDNSFEAATTSGNNLFIATMNSGVCRTTNYGDTWDTVNYGLPTHDITGMGSYNGVIYAGTYGEGTYKSTNNGNNWTSINITGHILGFAFDGNNIMVGRCDSVFRTSNGGLNWYPVSTGLTMYCENTRLYQTGSYVFLSSCGKLFMTTNFGTNWRLKNQGLESYGIISFAASSDKVFAGTIGSSVWRRNLSDIIGIHNISSEIPDKYSLMQNYPNPFNPSTTIRFQIKDSRFVKLSVYDAIGKEVAILVNEILQAGLYEIPFSINQFSNNNISSGVYYYRLTAGDFTEVKKMVLIK
jgi:hypothetical protein